MATEFRAILTATFDNAKDRDKCVEDVKTLFASKKSMGDVYKKADIKKDDYYVPEQNTIIESL